MRESVMLAPLVLADPKHEGPVVDVEVALGQRSSVGRRDRRSRQGPRRVRERRGAQELAVVAPDVEGVPVPGGAGDGGYRDGVVAPHDVVVCPHGVVVCPHGVVVGPHGVVVALHYVVVALHDVAAAPHGVVMVPHGVLVALHGEVMDA
jgi:hypothetical protein